MSLLKTNTLIPTSPTTKAPKSFTYSIKEEHVYDTNGEDILSNYVVPLTGEQRKAAGKGHYEIDAYFPGGMLGFEYYGKDGHTGTVREVKDIRRESILNDKGIAIHVVTKSQAENAQEIIRLAQVVRNARGLRKRTFRLEDVARTQRLLDLLYRSGRQPWWDADIIPLD